MPNARNEQMVLVITYIRLYNIKHNKRKDGKCIIDMSDVKVR